MEKITVQKDYVNKTEFKSSVNAINKTLKALKIDVNYLKGKVTEIDKTLRKLTGIVLRIEQRTHEF